MKKLIALILILVITNFVVVSKDSIPLSNKIAIENSRKPNPKNKNWEYVKDRLFDSVTEKVYKREGPILISLTDASKEDSIVVDEIIKELRIVIPNKRIDYFNNFTGKSFEIFKNEDLNKNQKGFALYDLMKSTTEFVFSNSINSDFELFDGNNYRLPNDCGTISGTNSSRFLYESLTPFSCYFYFRKPISFNQRKKYIQYAFLRTLCYLNPSKQYGVDFNTIGVYTTPDYIPDKAEFNDTDKFLLQKLYSDDFIDQFKTYLYTNYPWRYASSFINKKEHEFKVFAFITGLGILVFVLMFSYFQGKKYKYSYFNYLFPIFLIFLYFLNFSNIHNYLTVFNSCIEWDNGILFQLVLSILIAPLISFLLWGLEKSFKGNESFSYQLILKVIFTFLSFLVLVIVVFLSIPDANGLLEFLFPYIFFSAGLAAGRGLLLYLNHFSESLVKEKDLELSRLREAKAEAEVKVLQSQINPHFLYNALNSIASLAHTDADKTEKMALSLSDLFRHSINRKAEKINSLQDEVNLVRNYLEIEQIRFGDRLKFSIEVEPDLLTVDIPMFILQPLVENAIKHGISKIEEQGEIVLQIAKKDSGILISVQDNGPDFPEGLVTGHGLQTVYDLLQFSYGDKAEISWQNQPEKKITIHITDI